MHEKHPGIFSSFDSLRVLTTGAVWLAIVCQVLFADQTWDGGGGDNNWNTAANWGSDTLPTFASPIVFSGVTQTVTNNDLSSGTLIGGLNFANTNASGLTGNFTLGGNNINLGGNITTTQLTTGAPATLIDIINLNMRLTGDRTFNINSSGTGATLLAHNLEVNGVISEDVAGRSLTKSGAGMLTLTNTSTFSGNTTINSGTLRLQGSNSSAGNTVLTAGRIQLDNASNGGLASGSLILTSGTVEPLNAARSISNPTFLGGSVSVQGNQDLTFAGNFVATNNNASRTLTNTLDSGSVLSLTGPLSLGAAANTAARTFTVAGNGTTTISGDITNGNGFNNHLTIHNSGFTTLFGNNSYSGFTSMNANGGTLRFSGTNSSAGGTFIADGKLEFNNASNGGIASGNLTLQGGSIEALNAPRTISSNVSLSFTDTTNVVGSQSLTMNGTASVADTSKTLSNTMTAGTLRLQDVVLSSSSSAVRTLTIAGNGTTVIGNFTNSGANNIFTSNVSGAGSVTVDTNVFISESTAGRTLTFSGNGTTTVTGVISNSTVGATGGAGHITKAGTGVLVLSGANTYTGNTTIDSGTLRLGAANVIPDTGTVIIQKPTLNGPATSGVLDLNGNNEIIGPLRMGSASVNANTAGQTPSIINTGGPAALTLGGTVTYSGGGGGFLNGMATISADLILPAIRTFIIGDGAGTVDMLISGKISETGGARSLIKQGDGVLRLSGANSYGGNTQVLAGTLQLGANDVIPNTGGNTSLVLIGKSGNTTGVLDLNGFSDTIGSLLLGDSATTASDAGQTPSVINSGGPAALTVGNVFYRAGSAGFENGMATVSANLILPSNRNFTIENGAAAVDTLISGNIGETGTLRNLTKLGDGVLSLTGTNTYTGATNVNAGTLLINGDNSGATGAVNVGPLASLGGTGIVGGNTTINGTHTPGTSPGTQTFAGNLNYSNSATFVWELIGNTTAGAGINYDRVLTNGTLTIDPLANSSLVFNGPGSTVDWTDSFWDSNQQWLVFDNISAPSISGSIFGNIAISLDSLAQSGPTGSFSWIAMGDDVYLNYSAVPEPTSLGGAIVLFGSWCARRRKRPKTCLHMRLFTLR